MDCAILGGTFDPIHLGHLAVAEGAREALGLDSVWLMPSGIPPHKRCLATAAQRLEMCRLAAENGGLMVSDIEIERGGMTYTVDTIAALQASHPGDRWRYIIGADLLDTLPTWHDFERLAHICGFLVVGRDGVDDAGVPEKIEALRKRWGLDIQPLSIRGPEISSSMVREKVALGEDIAQLVPRRVAEYIRSEGLYLCGMTWEEIEARLQRTLRPGRVRHTLGVAETAVRLAARYGIDPQRARLAAMLHDCAKSMPYGDMVALVRREVPDCDEQEIASEAVLHAPAGMALAKNQYGVRDPAVLSAIRWHTLGGADMTPLEALIYVSDFIEPTRRPFRGLEEARALAEVDLNRAAVCCAALTVNHVRSLGNEPHPRTLRMLREQTLQ